MSDERREVTDQMGRTIHYSFPPKRIISLVPSQTELLHYLGLEQQVVGITGYCIHPDAWYRSKPRIGGTKKFRLNKIEELAPDLIIGNKEENEQQQMEALMERYPVWMSDIFTLDDAFDMIQKVGHLVDREAASISLVQTLKKDFENLHPSLPPSSFSLSSSLSSSSSLSLSSSRSPSPLPSPSRVAYLIWRSPWMVAGVPTFIDHLMQRCGWTNVFSDRKARYPEVNDKDLQNARPDLILLSSEPYPFKETHIAELQRLCPTSTIRLVDGELFSWYGSRLLHTPAYLRDLIER